MLAFLLDDLEWVNWQLDLLHQQHLERIEFFKQERAFWKRLQRVHLEQRTRLASQPFNAPAQAFLINEQIRQMKDWQRRTGAMLQTIKARQNQEMADLNEKR